jgi:amino acid transporter/nucleotide-binding universal stress UspA family protein
MVTVSTNRPRNVDVPRAAAILYGDWGTSKVYVIGLAFAIAGYSSFWLIVAMCALTALVGVNYITICKHYPDGGGVYASVRQRSEVVSIIGAIALVGGYIVTAAISALSAFLYLRVPHPEIFAAAAIFIVGALNYFGPRHTGGLAFLISVPAVIMVLLLGIFSAPYLTSAIHNLQPLSHNWNQNWIGFVGIVLALSGVEAVANSTGVMRLNPGSSLEKPSVSKTSTPAILIVMAEVCIFTALLGLVMHALPNLIMIPAPAGMPGEVNAPGHPGVRDYMLRYMGEFFVGNALGPTAGNIFGWLISIIFGFLLLSAVNTVIGALISISFLMSRDRELPPVFQKLNQFGVPVAGMIMAAIVPVVLVLVVKDMAGLADLYAIGVVGAIAANLGAASTDRKLALKVWERALMFVTFLIMAAIELTLLINKPHARVFAVTMLAAALVLRAIAFERARKKDVQIRAVVPAPAAASSTETHSYPATAFRDPLLVAVRGIGKTLDFAIEEARETGRALYVLFVREQAVVTQEDRARKWQQDDDARKIIDYAREKAKDVKVIPCYTVSDSAADTIVEIAATIGVSRLIVGAPQRSTILHFFRGNLIRQVSSLLPENIHLLVYA